jgi:hypothetical protein
MTNLTHPRALTIVAWLFIATGAWSAYLMGASLLPAHQFIPRLDVLQLLFGFGLLAHRSWALRWSGLWLVLTISLGVVGLAILAIGPGVTSFDPKLPWNAFASASRNTRYYLLLGSICARLALSLWQYRVLVRSDVRALFPYADPDLLVRAPRVTRET